jgi:ATP-dependent DNA helicase RecG
MGEEAQHIRYKGLDKKYYKDLILALIREHGPISKEKINELLLDKLPEILTEKQKKTKIHNLLSELSRREGKIACLFTGQSKKNVHHRGFPE